MPGTPHNAPFQRVSPRDAVTDREIRFMVDKRRDQRSEARDFELINRAADELSREVEDVLQYQDLDV